MAVMDREAVRQKLIELYPAREAFIFEFSGKKSRRVNGTYYPALKKIVIHEKNFTSENQLMYTAIHELAHHVVSTEYGERKARSHTKLFWATFHNLQEAAEKKGIYVRDRPAAIKELAEKARKIDRSIAKLQRELGIILSDLQELCAEAGERYEDVVEHDIGMARLTAKKAQEAASIFVEGELGQDAQALALRAGSAAKQAAVIEQAGEGKSIAQIEELARPWPRAVGHGGLEDMITTLRKEKRRVEAAILVLQYRLENVARELERAEEEEKAGVAGG
jgi:hypothetical protein